MFFMAGMYPERKELNYHQPILCSNCSQFGRYEAYMECNVLSLFFIPVFKFDKKYYLRTTCCNTVYLITNLEMAKMIERGQESNVFLNSEDLLLLQTDLFYNSTKCLSCGFETEGSFKYCPNCGKPLK